MQLTAEQRATWEAAARLIEGDVSAMPLDSSDITCGEGMTHVLLPNETDPDVCCRAVMLLAEYRAVTRQAERKAMAAQCRNIADNLK